MSDREIVGLCGPNGAGKTTLLRIFANLDEPDSGVVAKPSGLRVGYLPQDGLVHEGHTLHEEASLAFEWLLDVRRELQAIEDRLADPAVPEGEHEAMLHRYSDLQDRFRLHDGYAIDLKIDTVLRGLGFSPADYDKPTATFSGGWQMRIALAKLLLAKPDLLLLDEPTNHLDLDARNWLEEYLHDYPHAVILVSHDRFFLDAVVDRITDIHLRTLVDYHCNYSQYLLQRDERLERLRDAKRRQDEEVARIEMFINRFRYTATKAAQVQDRVKMLEKVRPIEVPPERKRVHFHFPTCEKSGRMVFDLKGVRKAYGTTRVFDGINLYIERGDRVALLGPNGAGKSTLMRMLSGVEEPDAGTRTLGHQVVMQYFAQDEAVRLDPDLHDLRNADVGLAGPHGPDDPRHPRRVPLLGRRRLQARRRALRRRAHAPGRGAHAAAAVEHAAPRRADQPPRPRLEGRAARRPHGLRRHAHRRLARPVLHRQAGHEGRRDRERARAALSRHLRGIPLEQDPRGPGPGAPGRPGQGQPRAEGAEASPRPAQPSPGAKTGGGAPKSPGPMPKADRVAGYDAKKRADADARKRDRERKQLQARITDLEGRITVREQEITKLEAAMAVPGFYEDREKSKVVVDRHQTLMWEVGDLMGQWEALQAHATEQS